MTDTGQSHELLIAALDSLLDRERAALLEGALDRIGPLTDEKATLIAQLTERPPDDPEAIRPLHLKLRRNQQLFDQALAGIRNVADRLGALRQIRKSMQVYDAQGQRATIGAAGETRLERRA
ncbi:flagellar protein FlgN [Salipiger sp. P9]|uniref:flagellar protein FlgN n=1 Tax=Salipiger pentaromativorans TaxID=2943193 RepID=UPI00215731D4|nr:flagellar protein FlgN [Salipiger pentaromativorans]MCR8549498.1 flagellar protein FlgN [Salipiger pentaromativorans]